MPNESKGAVLIEISTDLLVNELARRAKMKNMTVDDLWNEARENWAKAQNSAEDLLNAGHDTETAQ